MYLKIHGSVNTHIYSSYQRYKLTDIVNFPINVTANSCFSSFGFNFI